MAREAIEFINANLKGHLIGAEVGCDNGRHALEIIRKLDCKLYLIDIWEDYYENFMRSDLPKLTKKCCSKEDVEETLKGHDVEVIKGYSVEVAKRFDDNFFDFVYIDGNHTYEKVKEDILAWYPKVKVGGILGGHDYVPGCEGVKAAVNELIPFILHTRYGFNAPSGGDYVQIVCHYPDWWTYKTKAGLKNGIR